MIQVVIDLSRASAAEAARFFSMPGVGRAVDAMSHPAADAAVNLQLLTPDPGASPPAPAFSHVRADRY